jgi:hypothetical protein
MQETNPDPEQCRETGLSGFDLRIITDIFETK